MSELEVRMMQEGDMTAFLQNTPEINSPGMRALWEGIEPDIMERTIVVTEDGSVVGMGGPVAQENGEIHAWGAGATFLAKRSTEVFRIVKDGLKGILIDIAPEPLFVTVKSSNRKSLRMAAMLGFTEARQSDDGMTLFKMEAN